MTISVVQRYEVDGKEYKTRAEAEQHELRKEVCEVLADETFLDAEVIAEVIQYLFNTYHVNVTRKERM